MNVIPESGFLLAQRQAPTTKAVLGVTLKLLIATCWCSAAIFGVYIIAFYGASIPRDTMARWNDHLPSLYESSTPLATATIGTHFLTGALLLVLGPVQLVSELRRRWPSVHRWLGRLYVASSGVTGLGGLGFILAKGTVGGPVMNVGFAFYGVLMVVAAVETFRQGYARRLPQHRAWGIRLFALVIGSWLYRIEYGFWLPLTHSLGHTHSFTGFFDHFMSFFFYVPNLVIAEIYIHTNGTHRPAVRLTLATVFLLGAAMTAISTFYFTRGYWGPGILAAL